MARLDSSISRDVEETSRDILRAAPVIKLGCDGFEPGLRCIEIKRLVLSRAEDSREEIGLQLAGNKIGVSYS